jgi:hypothetical protein
MGREARCVGRFEGQSGEGKLLLETHELLFRGPFRLVMPLKELSDVVATEGELRVTFGGRPAAFVLGPPAAAWVKAILQPKGLFEKLGIKPGQRVAVVGLSDAAFLAELTARGAEVLKKPAKELHHLFYALGSEQDLTKLDSLRTFLRPDGALWVLRPKGRTGVSKTATMAAGKKAGLVDVKVVGFSAVYSAGKFVIPVAKR